MKNKKKALLIIGLILGVIVLICGVFTIRTVSVLKEKNYHAESFADFVRQGFFMKKGGYSFETQGEAYYPLTEDITVRVSKTTWHREDKLITEQTCFVGEKTAFGTYYRSEFDQNLPVFSVGRIPLTGEPFDDYFYIFETKDHTVIEIISNDKFFGMENEPVLILDNIPDPEMNKGAYCEFFLLPPLDEIPADYTFASDRQQVVLSDYLS